MNIIEHLKDKSTAQPFGLRTPEEQEIFRKAGKPNVLYYCVDGTWEILTNPDWCCDSTYILRPDYQPEPEYIDIELVPDGIFWKLKKSMPCCIANDSLRMVPIHRQFVKFRTDSNYTRHAGIATDWANKDEKVVARFRKETT